MSQTVSEQLIRFGRTAWQRIRSAGSEPALIRECRSELQAILRSSEEQKTILRDIIRHMVTLQEAIVTERQSSNQLFENLQSSLFPGRGELGFNDPRSPASLFLELCRRAQSETASIIKEQMPAAVCILDHREFLLDAVGRSSAHGLILEFGVFSGKTLRWMAEAYPDRKFVGFDSFYGLSSDWKGYKSFNFNLNGHKPVLPENVELVCGQFDQELSKYKAKLLEISMVHVDCDLYESSRVIFDELGRQLRPGTIIVFDEYFNYPGFREHEFRAAAEFSQRSELKFEWISYSGERAAARLVD